MKLNKVSNNYISWEFVSVLLLGAMLFLVSGIISAQGHLWGILFAFIGWLIIFYSTAYHVRKLLKKEL